MVHLVQSVRTILSCFSSRIDFIESLETNFNCAFGRRVPSRSEILSNTLTLAIAQYSATLVLSIGSRVEERSK